jgi:hypothetical protein
MEYPGTSRVKCASQKKSIAVLVRAGFVRYVGMSVDKTRERKRQREG